MNTPLVTIGLPAVKAIFLEKSIKSCLSQSYSNIEIIIQNNAIDQTKKKQIKEIVEKFSDNRIRYHETKNQIPMVQNWNSILQKAKGEFFSILCDDDLWEPRFIEEIILLSNKYQNTNIFHSRVVIINDQGEIVRLTENYPEYEDCIDFIYYRLTGHRSTYLSDFVVKTKSLRDINGYVDLPDGWGSDTITWFKLSLIGGIGYTREKLCNYRVSNINVSNSKSNRNKHRAIDEQYEILEDIFNLIRITDRYTAIQKQKLLEELGKFRGKNKAFLIKQTLINRYHIPKDISLFLSITYKVLYNKIRGPKII